LLSLTARYPSADMGKYTFSWCVIQSASAASSAPHPLTVHREHAANEVLVTGTFDDWQKTVRLENHDGVFKKSVELPKTHTQYKVRVPVAAAA
jgi:hypothetical protein